MLMKILSCVYIIGIVALYGAAFAELSDTNDGTDNSGGEEDERRKWIKRLMVFGVSAIMGATAVGFIFNWVVK